VSQARQRADYLVVNLARQIRAGETVFSGVNSLLAAAACLVAKRAYDWDFTYLNVAGGVDPVVDRLPRSSSDAALLGSTPAIFANEDFYDLCARGRLDLVFLGAAQIDARGRTNVSVIGPWRRPKVRLPGGGGAAVMMPTAGRVVVWRTEHSPRSLPERLDFVTAAGNVRALVTPLAVFRRGNGRFTLESHRPDVALAEVQERTGFAFDAERAVPTPPPTDREREALRRIDPEDLLLAEVGG
jgi:glutaconate CoA-transferase subunit B